MNEKLSDDIISLDLNAPIWERFFLLAPMVLIGTIEPDGQPDLAPKHMATPMGWDNYFGFVCTPRHGTDKNIERTGVFTVTYPPPILRRASNSPRS
jgi:flavin reductase (DIM6/NTAB) family NADH-FMN oxidoreductase RutF